MEETAIEMLTRPVRRAARTAALCALLALPGLGSTAAADDSPVPPDPAWTLAWHVVRPADTLEGLARRFVGSHTFWRELHRINPRIANPHRITPGDRIRIWVAPQRDEATAQVDVVAGRVDEEPLPIDWQPARRGDLLLERDGLRTFAQGSSRLVFDDGSSVTLSENSLVFLRPRPGPARPLPRREIEIELGEADIAALPAPARRAEVEIVVGSSRSRTAAAPGSPLLARSQATPSGTARLMVYRGSGEVEAAGERVELPEGTGTSVAPSAPPAPAEPLLPAPEPTTPAPEADLGLDDPWLVWQPVAGAESYRIEVCRDPECGEQVEQQRDLPEPRARLALSDASTPLYWRVAATSSSGLDGYASPARRFRPVTAIGPLRPELRLFDDAGRPVADSACLASPPRLEPIARNRGGSATPVELLVDGEPIAGSQPDWDRSGSWRLAVQVSGPDGTVATSPERQFFLDLEAPALEASVPPLVRPHRASPVRRGVDLCRGGMELTFGDGRPAVVLPCTAGGLAHRFDLAAGQSSATLFASTPTGSLIGRLDAQFTDAGCGVAALEIKVGRDLVELILVDRAGRQDQLFWTVDPW